MLTGAGPAYVPSLIDRIANDEGVAAMVLGLGVVALGSCVRPSCRLRLNPWGDLSPVMVRVTHPFHLRFRQELKFVKRLRNWRTDRVYRTG